MNLNGILRGLKEGIKERKLFLEHQQTVPPTQEHSRLEVDCLGVHTSISNFLNYIKS